MDEIITQVVQLVHQHLAASLSVVAFVSAVLARVDTLIRIALRFVPPDMLKAAIDRIEKRIDDRIDRVAGVAPAAAPVEPPKP